MTDIEKVIKGLHCHLAQDCRLNKCPYANDDACTSNVFLDAVELLEEYKQLQRWATGHGLTTCKNCKYGEPTRNALGEDMIKCEGEFPDWLRYPDWFCADGEAKK